MCPTVGHKLINDHGTAPGAWFEDADGHCAALMPGVSREMKAMWAEQVRPILLKWRNCTIHSRTLRVLGGAAYVHGPKVEAAGGLPVGTSGRALNLLSGGIDSPVAAWCMARRGLALHHIHFASPPYTSLRAKLKVRDLARELVEYTGNCTLFVVPYTKPQEYIRDNAPDVLFTVLMRRSMLRIANQVAKKLELQALITGESLAQVASQTMAALACTDQAQDLPVLRPCIGMDKIEIINISRKIGTFETSIEPYEDCCTIFTPPHPKTNPTLEEILAAEAAMPGLAALEAEAAENVEKIYIRMGDEELL